MTEQDNEAGRLNAMPLVEECGRELDEISQDQDGPDKDFLHFYYDDLNREYDKVTLAVLGVLNRRGLLTLEGVQALQMMKEEK